MFDEHEQRCTTVSLFPDDQPIPADAVDSLQVRLSGLELRLTESIQPVGWAVRYGINWGWMSFGGSVCGRGREKVSWEKVLRLLVVNRLLEPGSEFRVHRHWFVESAMDALLDENFQVADKDRLYRCLDRLLEHKQFTTSGGTTHLLATFRQTAAKTHPAPIDAIPHSPTNEAAERSPAAAVPARSTSPASCPRRRLESADRQETDSPWSASLLVFVEHLQRLPPSDLLLVVDLPPDISTVLCVVFRRPNAGSLRC